MNTNTHNIKETNPTNKEGVSTNKETVSTNKETVSINKEGISTNTDPVYTKPSMYHNDSMYMAPEIREEELYFRQFHEGTCLGIKGPRCDLHKKYLDIEKEINYRMWRDKFRNKF